MATPKLNLTTTNVGGDGKSFLGWRQEIDNPTSSNMTKIDDFAIEAAASTLVLKNKTNFAGTNGDLLMISTGSGVTSGSGLADIAGRTLPYVTFSTSGDLTAERVLNVSNGLLISTATSGKVFITPNIISGSGVLVKTTAATSAIQLSANITTGSNVEFSINSGSAVKVNAKMKGGVSRLWETD